MKLYIGADHNGYHLKSQVVSYLKNRNFDIIDEGDETLNPDDDFTVFASRVVHAMKSSEDNDARGILICGSGQGMAMAANRFAGIRAGVGWSVDAAKGVRRDEDSNILALPASVLTDDQQWQEIIDIWLNTPFENAERFRRRNRQLDELR